MDRYIAWIKNALANNSSLSQAGLARHLNMDRASVNRVLKGARHLQLSEVKAVAAYLGVPPPEDIGISTAPLPQQRGLPLVGRIERHAWVDEAAMPAARPIVMGLADSRYPEERQVVLEVISPATKERLARGDRIVCMPWKDVRTSVLPDDLIVVQRIRSGLQNYILARGQRDLRGNLHLVPATDGATQDEVGHPVYLVIGSYSPRA